MGREERIAGQGDWADNDNATTLLPRLWATRKVGYLVDDARRSGRTVDGEVREEIIKLSKKYGIVTPFTAGLITEDERQSAPPARRFRLRATLSQRHLVFCAEVLAAGLVRARGASGAAGRQSAMKFRQLRRSPGAVNAPTPTSGPVAVRAQRKTSVKR